MAYGTNPHETYSYGAVTDDNLRRFRQALGLDTTDPARPVTIDAVQSAVTQRPSSELDTFGKRIQGDLTGSLDEALLADALEDLEASIGEVPALRDIGIPEEGTTPYQDLTDPAWAVLEHLSDIGFFESTERHLPQFSSEFIELTTEELLFDGSVVETLDELGLAEDEQLALLTNIVNSSEQLAWWDRRDSYPTAEAPDEYDEAIEEDHIAPLQQRAMEGSLLWIDGLDWWLYQRKVLITDEMIDKGVWDIKSMLVGAYLFTDAARRAAEGTISDERFAAQLMASSAIMIIGQEFLIEDLIRIRDDDRAPLQNTSTEA